MPCSCLTFSGLWTFCGAPVQPNMLSMSKSASVYDDDDDDVSGPRSSGPDRSQRPRRRLSIRQGRVAADWSAQPHYASACQQLRALRAQACCHHWRQGLHLQGVEKSSQLPQDQHTQREHSRQCTVRCCTKLLQTYFCAFSGFLVIIGFILARAENAGVENVALECLGGKLVMRY